MKLEIGDRVFELPRVKAKKLRKLLVILDKTKESTSMDQEIDYTLEFFAELLGDKQPEVTAEWLEENLDAYMCGTPFWSKLMIELMAEPKNANEPEANESPSESSLTT